MKLYHNAFSPFARKVRLVLDWKGLEHAYPEKPVYPSDPAARVRARAWERCADAVIDPILADISYWSWAERPDRMPAGMKEAAQADLDRIYDALERDLEGHEFVCGDLSIADLACSRICPPCARSASRSRRSAIPGWRPG